MKDLILPHHGSANHLSDMVLSGEKEGESFCLECMCDVITSDSIFVFEKEMILKQFKSILEVDANILNNSVIGELVVPELFVATFSSDLKENQMMAPQMQDIIVAFITADPTLFIPVLDFLETNHHGLAWDESGAPLMRFLTHGILPIDVSISDHVLNHSPLLMKSLWNILCGKRSGSIVKSLTAEV
jgi:hypothetical protein